MALDHTLSSEVGLNAVSDLRDSRCFLDKNKRNVVSAALWRVERKCTSSVDWHSRLQDGRNDGGDTHPKPVRTFSTKA